MRYRVIAGVAAIVIAGGAFIVFNLLHSTPAQPALSEAVLPTEVETTKGTQYLTFQIFTSTGDSKELDIAHPPQDKATADIVSDIVKAIGTTGDANRKLGFTVGPLSFDMTDDDTRELIRDSFAIALAKNVAVGLHIDDSMFWSRLSYLNKSENIEWLDWNKTPNTGRRVDWGPTPIKIMPQLCWNSPAVKAEVVKRAGVIAEEVQRGIETLRMAGKPELFAGVIAGWETQMSRDFDTGQYLGYCALINKGYSASNPPKDMDEARVEITKEFVDLWAKSLSDAGVSDTKIFSHTTFTSQAMIDAVKFQSPEKVPASYLQTINFAHPRISFGSHYYPGFSTYPEIGHLEQIQAERAKNGNPPWASSEGTALDPSQADREGAGDPMEPYLGDLFNHGAVLVNVFGWAVGPSSNSFRKVAENESAITAYQKFLHGDTLKESPAVQVASSLFYTKIQKLQKELAPYMSKNANGTVSELYKTFSQQLEAKRFTDAEATIDAILKFIEE